MIPQRASLLPLSFAVIALAHVGACGKTKVSASDDGSGAEAGLPPSEDAAAFNQENWITCGGTMTVAGETPYGALSVTEIFVSLPYCPRRVAFTLKAKWMPKPMPTVSNNPRGHVYDGQQLDMVIAIAPHEGQPAVLIGPFQASATLTTPGQPKVTTTATVEVSRADDPFPDGGAPNGQEVIVRPPGSIAGTFNLVDNGFSLSGSFDSPYCYAHDQCSTL